MINDVVAHVELEHEIVEWTSSIANSLALIFNTVHKRCCVASNGSGVSTNGVALREITRHNVEWYSVHTYGVALREMVQRNVEWYSVGTNGVVLREMAQRNVEWYSVHTNGVELREIAQRNVE
ncbi:unnamed protein product [Pocillopora meandrina]|uniref:Uncharacterized protein n=1 Tax=Pocillopora meandrina TaxID=46732 RepID=A0AAU9XML2_9CNID|nr:unnamed protein product [Pocillopora meandrina]